jgi:hypothetical protein
VGNAIKFTEQGEIAVRVEKEQQDQCACQLHFGVRDTGISPLALKPLWARPAHNPARPQPAWCNCER